MFIFEAGLVWAWKVRSILKECQFHDTRLEWLETSDGLLSRRFTIKGHPDAVRVAYNALAEWNSDS